MQQITKPIKPAILISMAALLYILMPSAVSAFDQVNSTFFGVAIKGYDTVAYHTEGRAIKGQRKYAHQWNDAKWHFTSAANRDLFVADPEKYAPQYGGY
jgi:hypothetical protein